MKSLIIIVVFLAAGLGTVVLNGADSKDLAEYKIEPTLDPSSKAWVEHTLAKLTVREMAGQLMASWVTGAYASIDSEDFDEALKQVEGGVGGLWMWGGLPHERAAKLNALQEKSKVPLLVIASNGMGQAQFAPQRDVSMLGSGTDIPPSMAYGAIGDPDAIREAGRIIAREARATGLHFRGDPDCSVLTNLDNVLHNRTLGDDPVQVGQLAAAFVKGAHEGGMATSAGFFPGAGSLGSDPHVSLPNNSNDRSYFERVDFPPFRDVIKAGTDGFVSSHFTAPILTGSDTLPVTFSPQVTRILREEFGYDGILCSDAMGMGGIIENYKPMEAAMLAVKAGNDIILGTSSLRAADELTALVEAGEYSVENLKASVRRILELKARLGLHRGAQVSLESVNQIVGNREHQRAADSAANRSIVLLRDAENRIPFSNASDLRVLALTYEREDNEQAGQAFARHLRPHLKAFRSIRISPSTELSVYEDIRNQASSFDAVVLSVYLRPQLYGEIEGYAKMSPELLELFGYLESAGIPVSVISFGELQLLNELPDLETLMMAWSEQPVMQRAAARALLGQITIQGLLPLSLPPHHSRGDGLTRANQSP